MPGDRSPLLRSPRPRDPALDPGIGRVILGALAVLLVTLAVSQGLGRLEPHAARLRPVAVAIRVPDRPLPAVRPAERVRHPQARPIAWTPV